MIPAVMNAILWNCVYRSPKNSGFQRGLNPWSSQFWTQFKQLRTEAWKSQDFNGVWTRDIAIPVRRFNQLSYEATDVGTWSFVGSNQPVRNLQLYLKYFIYRTADVESSKLWSSQLWTQFYRIACIEARKIHGFNGVWTRDPAIPVRRSNQLSYEATDPIEVLNFSGLYLQLNCGNMTLINWFDAKL